LEGLLGIIGKHQVMICCHGELNLLKRGHLGVSCFVGMFRASRAPMNDRRWH
jgi:hypothetical protein